MTISQRRAALGAGILICTVQYLAAEAVASAAWRAPPYSYWQNYVSDLGVPGCGQPAGASPVCSPLANVMNTGFVLAGLLAIAAAVLLAPLIPGVWRRWVVVALAMVHGLGSILVGFVHSAPGTLAGTPHAHVIGAYMAILGGNLAILTLGIGLGRTVSLWLRAALAALAIVGFAGGSLLVIRPEYLPGLFERMAVDPITMGEVLAGVTLALALARRARLAP